LIRLGALETLVGSCRNCCQIAPPFLPVRDRDGAALASADDLTAADDELLEFVTEGRSCRPSARNSEKTIRSSVSVILNKIGK
jgi:hypothetical protein